MAGSKDYYVGFFNIGENAHDVSVDFASLGLKEKVMVRDLWQKKNIGYYSKQYKQKINPHGSALLRLQMQ